MDRATQDMEEARRTAARVLANIRAARPLVLSLTNTVAQAFTANALLAVGASPVMLEDAAEAQELLRARCGSLLVNVGTLTAAQACTMQAAVRTANECGVPWVLDPVAVGILSGRTRLCRNLLLHHPAIVRGNPSEIVSLAADGSPTSRGTESTIPASGALDAARLIARTHRTTVLVTGEVDCATDGTAVRRLRTGHPLMARVAGTGCVLGALCAACLPCAPAPLEAATAAACILGEAGRRAAARATRAGSYATALLDELDSAE